MRSSLILGVALLLTIAAPSIVQAYKSEETCGNLGPGTWTIFCAQIGIYSDLAVARATQDSHATSQLLGISRDN